jgi:methionyl-tRNA formyltransferase
MNFPIPAPQRIVLIGSVLSSERTLKALVRHHAPVVGVLGLDSQHARNVAGYRDLSLPTHDAGVEYRSFDRVNTPLVEEVVRSWRPDLVFVVGLSQIVRPQLIAIATIGCVGFHPTRLPYGRGQAPMAWLILDRGPAAATFFVIDEGVDSGAILHQEPIAVSEEDSATELEAQVGEAIDRGLDKWLPDLLSGQAIARPQDESSATYFGRRRDEDGLIDWTASAEDIDRLVRAATRPYPGAYTYFRGQRLRIWATERDVTVRYRGVVGRVLDRRRNDGALLVQAGDVPLWMVDYEPSGLRSLIPIGGLLGYHPEDEVHRLHQRVAELENKLDKLAGRIDRVEPQ